MRRTGLAALAVTAALIAQALSGSLAFAAAPDPEPDSDGVQVTVEIAPRPDPPTCGNEPWPPGWPRRGHGAKPEHPGNGHGPKHDCPGNGNGHGPKPEHPGNGPGKGNGPKPGKGKAVGANAGDVSADLLLRLFVAPSVSDAAAPYDVVSKRAR